MPSMISTRGWMIAKRWGKETISRRRARTTRSSIISFKEGPLAKFFEPPDTVWTPRILKDGSDSVGALGGLNRVYLNIGLFSEEWLLHFNAIVGGKPITPIEISVAARQVVVLERYRSADPVHGAIPAEKRNAAPS